MEETKENSVIESEKGIGQEKGSEITKRKYEKQPLSIRELKFIKAITHVGGKTYGLPIPSARKAGYVESQLEHTTYRLMRNAKILAAISEVHAKRLEDTPANRARATADLDHLAAISLESGNQVSIARVNELRVKTLDLWNRHAPPDAEKEAEFAARMTAEEKKIALLIARCRTEAEARAGLDGECTPETLGKLADAINSKKE